MDFGFLTKDLRLKMKKNNNKVSKNKLKRAKKNKKRLSNKIQLSSFERKQDRLYGKIMNESALRMAAQKNIEG
jgi:hypothetical protein